MKENIFDTSHTSLPIDSFVSFRGSPLSQGVRCPFFPDNPMFSLKVQRISTDMKASQATRKTQVAGRMRTETDSETEPFLKDAAFLFSSFGWRVGKAGLWEKPSFQLAFLLVEHPGFLTFTHSVESTCSGQRVGCFSLRCLYRVIVLGHTLWGRGL